MVFFVRELRHARAAVDETAKDVARLEIAFQSAKAEKIALEKGNKEKVGVYCLASR